MTRRGLLRPLWAALLTVAFFAAVEGSLAAFQALVFAVFWRPGAITDGPGWVIATVGDSVMAGGSPTPDQNCWPARLATSPLLRARGYQVTNYARPGSDFGRIAEQAQRFLDGQAAPRRAVLVTGGFNDCLTNQGPVVLGGSRQQPTQVARGVLQRTRTYRFATQVVLRAVTRLAPPPATSPIGSKPSENCRAYVRSGLTTLATRAREKSARLVVVTYPVAAWQPQFKSRGDMAARTLDALLIEESQPLGLPVLDVVACVQAQERVVGERFFYDDGLHLMPSGSAATARCVARELPGILDDPAGR